MKLKDIVHTKTEIEALGYSIENNMIELVDIDVIGHFNNSACFYICCSNVSPMCHYNNTSNAGYIARAFVDLFELTDDNGIRLSQIGNLPCRLIFDGSGWGSKCIGFGHFMKDKFVLTEDFAKIDEI